MFISKPLNLSKVSTYEEKERNRMSDSHLSSRQFWHAGIDSRLALLCAVFGGAVCKQARERGGLLAGGDPSSFRTCVRNGNTHIELLKGVFLVSADLQIL
jgi:hypothetical protein